MVVITDIKRCEWNAVHEYATSSCMTILPVSRCDDGGRQLQLLSWNSLTERARVENIRQTVSEDVLPGARLTIDISIEFEFRSKLGAFQFKICFTNHKKILHTSRQLHYRDVCKISLWSVEYILNKSTAHFGRISNSIEISLVGRAPGHRFHQFITKYEIDLTWTANSSETNRNMLISIRTTIIDHVIVKPIPPEKG